MRSAGSRSPEHDDSGRRDLAYRVLAAAVAMMRPGRRDWGLAMLAELARIRSPGERAWFTLGAARVALFPPRAAPGWRAIPLGLAIRAVVAAAAIHALTPAAGSATVALTALPAAGAWGTVTMPALADRHGGMVLAARAAVSAGVIGFVALALATVQRYPAAVSGAGAEVVSMVFTLVSAAYLGLAWLLSRHAPAIQRNSLYALAAGLVMAAGAADFIAHPPLISLWRGPQPAGSGYMLACLAIPAATALAASHRGRLEDGLETAVWATLLAALIYSIMIVAATFRVAPAANSSPQIITDAHMHATASASAWLTGDNLGGATICLIWTPVIFMTLATAGAIIGYALRTTLNQAIAIRRPGGDRPGTADTSGQ